MGLIFKHMKDVDVVKNIVDKTFSKVEEAEDNIYDNQVGKAIRLEDVYDLIPCKGEVSVPSIAGTYKRECVLWNVIRYDYCAGVHYYSDGSGEPPSWDERELGSDLGFRDAILLVLTDWMSVVMVDNSLENMSYENDQMEEELNPMEI